jgi:hypothetical protein
MKKIAWIRSLIAGSCVSLSLISCLEELDKTDKIEKIDLTPEVGFPLIASDFTFEEFLTKGKTTGYVTDKSGLILLTYKDTLLSARADALFSVPDQQSPAISIASAAVVFPGPGGTATVNQSSSFSITPAQSEELDSIWLKTGTLITNIQSTFPYDVDLTLTIPGLKKQGQAFQQTYTLHGNTTLHPEVDLAGFHMDLTKNGTTFNTLSFSVKAVFSDNGSPMGGAEDIQVNFDLTQLQFRALFGKLGTRSLQIPQQTTGIDIFKRVTDGTFALQDPSITLHVANSFGFSAAMDISQIEVAKADGSTLAISGSAVAPPANPHLIGYPSLTQIGKSITTDIALNSSNSNIAALVSSLPNELRCQFAGDLNPGNTTNNFVLDTSKLEVGLNFELPLYGQVKGLGLTKSFNFSGIGIDNVDDATLVVKTVNKLPLDVYLQAYFVDYGGITVDSLFTDGQVLIKAAPIDAGGVPVSASEIIREASIDKAKVDRINSATSIVLAASISTTGNGAAPVKIMINSNLLIDVGVRARIKYSIN